MVIKIDVGASFKSFSSGVLLLKDGTCLTCYNTTLLTLYTPTRFSAQVSILREH